MAKLRLSGWGLSDQDGLQPSRLSSPLVFFWSQLIFLIMSGFLAAILYRQISEAFFANPGLNGLILFVLAIGIFLVFNQVLRLRPEVRWVNSFVQGADRVRNVREPTLLAPMRAFLTRKESMSLTTSSLRSIRLGIGKASCGKLSFENMVPPPVAETVTTRHKKQKRRPKATLCQVWRDHRNRLGSAFPRT